MASRARRGDGSAEAAGRCFHVAFEGGGEGEGVAVADGAGDVLDFSLGGSEQFAGATMLGKPVGLYDNSASSGRLIAACGNTRLLHRRRKPCVSTQGYFAQRKFDVG
jgi:hypothetical protein